MKKITKITLFSFSLITVFGLIGCSTKVPVFKVTKIKSLQIIKEIKKIDKKQSYLNKVFGVPSKNGLPNSLGASRILSKNDYELRKFDKESLLFPKFGVKNNIYTILVPNNWNKAESTAKSYGFKNVQDMYEYIYTRINKDSPKELYYMLKNLQNNKVLSLGYVMNKTNIEKEITRIISVIYGPYIKYEHMRSPEILPNWFTTFEGKKIFFTRKDYRPFALSILIVKQLLFHNNVNNFKIYGI